MVKMENPTRIAGREWMAEFRQQNGRQKTVDKPAGRKQTELANGTDQRKHPAENGRQRTEDKKGLRKQN